MALRPDSETVVSSGYSAKRVYAEAQKKGIKTPTLFRVPSKYIPYIG